MIKKIKLFFLMLIFIGIFVAGIFFSRFNPFEQVGKESNLEAPTYSTVDSGKRSVESIYSLNQTFIEVAAEVNKTVVTVFTEKTFKAPSFFDGDLFFGIPNESNGREYRQQGLGSGVIVSENGYILTNNHVVEGADTIQVRLMNEKTLAAKVIGTDLKTDIAVLKVDAEKLPAIKIGDSDRLQVGEIVMAIGSPMSQYLAHTVTHGIVSAKGRSNVGLAEYEDFIQTDAAINPGNSGGALINLNGELVGINTAIISRSGGFQGIGFAVPVNLAKNIMESLIKYGSVTRGWLGVYIQDVNEEMAKAMKLPLTEGSLVSQTVKNGPADEAGVEQGDFIVEFNGRKISSTKQLRNEVAATAPDTSVEIKLLRDGKEKVLKVKLGKLETGAINQETKEQLEKIFGLKVAPFDEELANKYGLDNSLNGVVITDVDTNSSAYRVGLSEGDLIVAINSRRIGGIEDFNNLIQEFKKGDTVYLRIVRRNRSFYVAFTL